MNAKEIEAAKVKVEFVKKKAEERLAELEAKRDEQDGGVDP